MEILSILTMNFIICIKKQIEDGSIATVLEHPQDYIDSKEFFSWERYFISLLIQKTQDSYLKYSKKSLNPVYLQHNEMEKILAIMKGVDFTE